MLGSLVLAGPSAAEEARCSAWRSAGKPHEKLELRTCKQPGADAASGDAGGEDAEDASAAGEGAAGDAGGAAYELEIRSGYAEERKLRVELVSADGAVETLDATVRSGVNKVGFSPDDVEKWRVLESTSDAVRKVAGNNHMEVLARDLRLTDRDAERLKRIAESYSKATRKRLVVTGGTRPPARQAQLMLDKLKRGEDIMAIYENKEAAREVRAVYRDGAAKNLPRKRLLRAITEVIEAQMARGVYVSKHLRSGAVDVRSWDMTPAMEQALKEAIKKEPGVTLMDERGSAEPHFHLSFL